MVSALVVCIGNDLVADDGAGHAVHRLLAARLPAVGMRLALLGLGGMSLVDQLQGEEHLIVVDAVQLGAPAGTIHVLDWAALPASGCQFSCHGIGVREAIEVSRKLYPEMTPQTVHLVGIEGRCFDQLGEGLSDEVAAAVIPAAAAVLSLLGQDAALLKS